MVLEEDKIRAELAIAAACKPVNLDILIVGHNQPEFTKNCLASVADTTSNSQLYLYDNGSSEPTAEILRNADLRGGRLIRDERNSGFIKPNNALAALGSNPYIVLLNTDAYCLPGWWEPLVGVLQNYPDVGVVGYQGATLNHDGVGSALAWGYDVDYVCGFCMAIRRADYERLGLFDEKNLEFAYCEDADFSFRVREAGMTTYALSLKLVWHKGHATSHAVDPTVLSGPFARNHEYIRQRWKKYLGRSL